MTDDDDDDDNEDYADDDYDASAEMQKRVDIADISMLIFLIAVLLVQCSSTVQ